MEILDDQGRLFGIVNLVDALTVLLVIAVLFAGAALLLGGDEETATRYASIDLGQQPEYVANLVSEGDVSTYTGMGDNLTVTDVYVTPSGDGGFFVTVRAELHGKLMESLEFDRRVFTFLDSVVRPGDEVRINTPDYSLNGVVRAVSGNNSVIRLGTTDAVVRLRNVDPEVADALSVGLTESVGGRTHARITNVSVEPAEVVLESDSGEIFVREHPRNKDVRLELELLTRQTEAGERFHGDRLQVFSSVTLDFDRVSVTGRIVDLGP